VRYGAMNFPIKPVLDEIERVASLGFDFLELALDAPQAHFSAVREQKDKIFSQLKNNQMGLVCHLPTFVYTADLTDSIRLASLREMLGSLETAKSLGAEKVVLHPGYIGGLGALVMEISRNHALTSLSTLVHKADELEMELCLENMFPRYLSFVEPEDFLPIFEAYPQLKLTLDTGHANIDDAGRDRALNFVKVFSRRLGHVHMSDNHGKRDDHRPVGEGTVPFNRIVRALKNAGYDGTLTLEIFTDDPMDLIASRERLKKMFM